MRKFEQKQVFESFKNGLKSNWKWRYRLSFTGFNSEYIFGIFGSFRYRLFKWRSQLFRVSSTVKQHLKKFETWQYSGYFWTRRLPHEYSFGVRKSLNFQMVKFETNARFVTFLESFSRKVGSDRVHSIGKKWGLFCESKYWWRIVWSLWRHIQVSLLENTTCKKSIERRNIEHWVDWNVWKLCRLVDRSLGFLGKWWVFLCLGKKERHEQTIVDTRRCSSKCTWSVKRPKLDGIVTRSQKCRFSRKWG